jgi:hypothetical protein
MSTVRAGLHRVASVTRAAVFLTAFVSGWSTLGYAQGTNGRAPSAPDSLIDWFCRALPLPSPWGASARSKKCAATFLLGRQINTGLAHIDGMESFVPPWAYKFGNSYFAGGLLSRVLGEIGDFTALEIEAGVGQRFGSLHEEEVWIALYGRWKYFPWNNYLRTTIAVSTGLSYASAIPLYEVLQSGNNQGSRLLHYLSPEITFGLPSQPDTDFVIRIQHRSGGGTYFGSNFPIYGSIFHRVQGGVQYLTVGIRQHF